MTNGKNSDHKLQYEKAGYVDEDIEELIKNAIKR
jgi:hypothetical protein